MKILILSSTPWHSSNSFGNTFSNIFEGMNGVEIASIFCKEGSPDNIYIKRYFKMTEKSLMKNLLNKKNPAGNVVLLENVGKNDGLPQNWYNIARKNRSMFLFWARDFIWKIGRWKSKELKKFIDDFSPDLLFFPLYYSMYLNDIAYFIKKYTNAPMFAYVSDDIYTMRQFSLSPFYWIDRVRKRGKIKKVANLCEHIYVISDIQKNEYEKCFSKKCKLLWKGDKFDSMPEHENAKEIVKFVYTGNIGSGRYKQLAKIGQALKQINSNGKKAELDIYTLTPMNAKMRSMLDITGAVNMKGGVEQKQIKKIQKEADVLVHVESFDLKNRLSVRQSFSTKIVDYFSEAKCIFAVGPKDVASIDYLMKNDAAVTAVDEDEIQRKLLDLVENRELIYEYGKKAWECGKRNHQIDVIQKNLKNDFEVILNESCSD